MIDKNVFGRNIKAARLLAEPPLLSAEELAEALNEAGYEVSTRTVYAWERGESLPSLDLTLGLIAVLRPRGGLRFFENAFPEEQWEKVVKTVWP